MREGDTMRFFHLSDLHIGLRLMHRDLYEDQKHILRQIADRAGEYRPDAVVIAGDIYDKAIPAAEATSLFDSFINELTDCIPDARIMIISGNHDSAVRLNLFRNILKKQNVDMIGLPPREENQYIEKVTLTDDYGPVCFYLLPFVRPSMIKGLVGEKEDGRPFSYDESIKRLIGRENIDQGIRNVLVSHQFYLPSSTDPEEVERTDREIRTIGNIDAVDAEVLNSFDYAALGHIHRPMTVGNECFRYCGSPLPASVSEENQQKSILMIDMKEKGNMDITPIPLHPLRNVRKIRGKVKDILKEACEDYVSLVISADEEELGMDSQDWIRDAFPYLLEIKKEIGSRFSDTGEKRTVRESDPYSLCLSFLGETDEEMKTLLKDVINHVKEEIV